MIKSQRLLRTSYNDEKEKARRRLNLIIHNVGESKADDSPSRKQEDIIVVSSMLKKYLGFSTTIFILERKVRNPDY